MRKTNAREREKLTKNLIKDIPNKDESKKEVDMKGIMGCGKNKNRDL